tara:strand:- start:11754 stop:12212 length:459 start_codon:yes stop_codon:yes gene_type:complete
LATKSTHKKQKYNKRQKQDLAVKLDKIAQKVSKRGAYVVTRNATDDFFIIIEALNKKVVLTHILQKNTAQGLCVRLNSRNRPDSPYEPATEMQMTRTQKLLNRYADLFTESIFHKHTIKTTKTNFTRDVAFIRLHETVLKLKGIAEEIRHQL